MANVCQLVYLRAEAGSSNFTLDLWPATLCNQAVLCLTVFTACLPYFKPFLDSTESGLLRADDLRRRKRNSQASSGRPKGKESGSSGTRKTKLVTVANENLKLGKLGHATTSIATVEKSHPEWDTMSDSSHIKVIRETRTWTVHSERDGDTRRGSAGGSTT